MSPDRTAHRCVSGDSPEPRAAGFRWRANIEAVTLALILAVAFKYFLVEAYRIPSASMQPTLFGWSHRGGKEVFDRILVDKFSYHYRDPERFEVATFRFPLDRSRTFIKRIVGLPGEDLKIEGGDLFRRDSEGSPWTILRKPAGAARSLLRGLETRGRWGFSPKSAWSESEGDLVALDAGRALYPADLIGVRDAYADGYPSSIAPLVREQGISGGENAVGDLRIEAEVRPDATTREVRFEIQEGLARYVFALPCAGSGGGSDADGADPSSAIRIEVHRPGTTPVVVPEPGARRLEAGRSIAVAVQNIDDQLVLELDGEILLEHEIAAVAPKSTQVALVTTGGGARFADLRVLRDIYYTSGPDGRAEWSIPQGSYVVLGDNTQASADSRAWRGLQLHVQTPGQPETLITGELRKSENPVIAPGPRGEAIVFRDQHGTRHYFADGEAKTHGDEPAPFVPRSAITGRAILVFWPLWPTASVHRWHWIR